MVGILSTRLLVLLALLVIALPLIALFAWNRLPGPRGVRVAGRLGLVLVAQVCAVALTGAYVNDQYAFYVSWHDLVGTPAVTGTIQPVTSGPVATPRTGATSQQQVLSLVVHGQGSGLTEPVSVYLPPGYSAPSNAHRRYPVVEFLAGWHGGPESWKRAMHLASALQREQTAGRLQPFIGIAPTTDVDLPRDIECTDLPGVMRAETWLTSDLRTFATRSFRTTTDGRSWGLLGYSEGAYCAMKFVLHHPSWYRSAVLMSGYYRAIHDSTTGDLWKNNDPLRHHNDPMWLLEHGQHPAVDLLAFSSKEDKESYPPTFRLMQAMRPPTRASQLIEPTGGHNLSGLRLALPQMLDWLSGHLQTPAPLRVTAG